MTTNLAIKGIATETKALVLLNEYEGRRLPMVKLRQVLQEMSSGPEETARILEMIQNHLTAEGADPGAVANFVSELNSPVSVVDELGKTTRRLRSPFAMGFETAGAVNVSGLQGGGNPVTPTPGAPAAHVHFPGPGVEGTHPPAPPPPGRLTPAQGMASGYGRPPAPPPPPPMPPQIPTVSGMNIPYPPPPGNLPNLPNPVGNLPMSPNIPMPPPGQPYAPHGVVPAAAVPRPGLGARPTGGTVIMNSPNSTLRTVQPPTAPGQPGRVTPLPADAAAVAKPSAHQAPLAGGAGQMPAGTVQRNTMHFGKNMGQKAQAKEDGRPVILVADDDKRVRMVHKIRLEEAGYNIVEASDGTEAWRRLQMGDITLAVLDMKMPGLHGLEVLARLIDSGRKIPVVICSAYDQLKDEFIVATYPWLRYLVKPVTPEAMMTAVKDLLAQASKSA